MIKGVCVFALLGMSVRDIGAQPPVRNIALTTKTYTSANYQKVIGTFLATFRRSLAMKYRNWNRAITFPTITKEISDM
jgi:hypothetical protein